MKTARGFVKDELGATMPLAMAMIVILGIMGAGLLTFVSRDFTSVIETNQGQRAFELADAGVAAAKRQLTFHCGGNAACGTLYDDGHSGGNDDIRWSAFYPDLDGEAGIKLTDLDGSATTPNEVNVAIEHRDDTGDFKVVSTGRYGVATRKIEAIFKGIITFGGGDQLGHPVYYTPSDIKIEATRANPVDIATISMFSAGDILIPGDYENDSLDGVGDDRQRFITEMDVKSGNNPPPGFLATTGQGQADELRHWCTTPECNTQGNDPFRNIPGNWNTEPRMENGTVYPGGRTTSTRHNSSNELIHPGLAAEGKICGFSAPVGSPPPAIGECPSDSPSIADGVYGYDCTTGPTDITVTKVNPLDNELVCASPSDPNLPAPSEPRGNELTFMAKECDPQTGCPDNQEGTISYPFPLPEPDEAALHEHADIGDDATDKLWEECDPTDGVPCSPPYDDLLGGRDEMAFVDANGDDVLLQNQGTEHGILVVWCGRLLHQGVGPNPRFQGVILNLYGDGTGFDASNCEGDGTKGTYRNMGNGNTMAGWLYSEGGTPTRAGIELAPGSKVEKFPGGKWNFEMDAFENAPPNAFSLRGWRELYE